MSGKRQSVWTAPAWVVCEAIEAALARATLSAVVGDGFAKQAGLAGRVLGPYNFGSYLFYAGVPTFIDGRAELFRGDFIPRSADIVALRSNESLEQLLVRHCTDWTCQSAGKRVARATPSVALSSSDTSPFASTSSLGTVLSAVFLAATNFWLNAYESTQG